MKRIESLSYCAAAAIVVWLAALLSTSGVSRVSAALAPVVLVALFGLSLLLRLAYNVVTFRSVPEEATILKEKIVAIKKELLKVGVGAN